MGINIRAEDIAACHHLPSANMNKPVIVKFIYNNQRTEFGEIERL